MPEMYICIAVYINSVHPFTDYRQPFPYWNQIKDISRNLVEYYCKCCILIDYATRYLFVDR